MLRIMLLWQCWGQGLGHRTTSPLVVLSGKGVPRLSHVGLGPAGTSKDQVWQTTAWPQLECPALTPQRWKPVRFLPKRHGAKANGLPTLETRSRPDLDHLLQQGHGLSGGLPWWLRWTRIFLPVQETWVWSLGWEDPPEKGKATHSSILGLPLWLSW